MRYNFQAVKKAFSVCVIKKIKKKRRGRKPKKKQNIPNVWDRLEFGALSAAQLQF